MPFVSFLGSAVPTLLEVGGGLSLTGNGTTANPFVLSGGGGATSFANGFSTLDRYALTNNSQAIPQGSFVATGFMAPTSLTSTTVAFPGSDGGGIGAFATIGLYTMDNTGALTALIAQTDPIAFGGSGSWNVGTWHAPHPVIAAGHLYAVGIVATSNDVGVISPIGQVFPANSSITPWGGLGINPQASLPATVPSPGPGGANLSAAFYVEILA